MTARAWIRSTWARLWGAPEFDAPTVPLGWFELPDSPAPPAPPRRRRDDQPKWVDTLDTEAELLKLGARPNPHGREYWLSDSDLGELSDLESRWAPQHQGSSPRERAEKR